MPSHVSINDDDVYGLGRAENIVALTGGLLDGSEIAAVDFQHGVMRDRETVKIQICWPSGHKCKQIAVREHDGLQ
ncbi:hypothetical protein V2G26_017014 [Clonostachys chloroleuca]